MTDRHLISRDELLAAGALDVPPSWRKSLGVERIQRDLFSDLPDDDASDEPQASERTAPDRNDESDESE